MSGEHFAAVTGGFIELCALLKREDMAASGGEAKLLISQGLVRVNGEVETRKRRKLADGDVVDCGGRRVRVTAG
ncbi:RNA-binding S4 domain-containing protein [Candidatus Electronema sp. TJ]|uniref:RNA-binding S4 domain-containing protein n=1 Tax=Candidatus Electronema sp. TJ TaxID=3401573 RepID=UPI003AA84AB9